MRPQVYLIDGWDNTADAVSAIKAKGGYPVCYFSAGTSENWRSDFTKFLPTDMGSNVAGWKGERWLNIRSDNVKAIMRARMTMCRDKVWRPQGRRARRKRAPAGGGQSAAPAPKT
jgi:hypothetical protein